MRHRKWSTFDYYCGFFLTSVFISAVIFVVWIMYHFAVNFGSLPISKKNITTFTLIIAIFFMIIIIPFLIKTLPEQGKKSKKMKFWVRKKKLKK